MRRCDYCKKPAVFIGELIPGFENYLCSDHYIRYQPKTVYMINESTKVCTICGKTKNQEAFYKNRSECKECNLLERKKVRIRKCRT